MKRPITAFLVLFICTFFTVQASASHYLLEDVPFVTPEELTALNGASVEATEDLLAKAATQKDRELLAKASGLTLDRVTALATLTDLLQIRGVGPKMALLFQGCQANTAAELAKQDIKVLYPRMKEVNRTHQISEVLPSEELVASWLRAAKNVPVKFTL